MAVIAALYVAAGRSDNIHEQQKYDEHTMFGMSDSACDVIAP